MLGLTMIVAAAVLMLRAVLLLRSVGDCMGRLDDIRFIASSLRTELSHASASSRRAWWLTLGVARAASIAQIDEAYRSQVKASHPDQTGGRGTGLDLAALQRARKDGQLEARKRAWWSQSGDRRAQ